MREECPALFALFTARSAAPAHLEWKVQQVLLSMDVETGNEDVTHIEQILIL
jgi:hypothetical protein